MDNTQNVGTMEYYREKCLEIEILLEAFSSEQEKGLALETEEKRFRELRTQMYDRYSGKYGTGQRGESHRYSEEELCQIRMELADTSFATLIKRFLGIGKSTKEIYSDLMSKLNGLIRYLHEQSIVHTEKKQDILGELLEKVEAYNREYEKIKATSGYLANSDWDNFQLSTDSDKRLLLANIQYPVSDKRLLLENVQHPVLNDLSQTVEEKIKIAEHCIINGELSYPYSLHIRNPFSIIYNYNKSNEKVSIQAVQSLIYQMLRLMPEYYCEFHLMDGATSGKAFGEIKNLQKVKKQDVVYMNQRITDGKFQLAKLYLDNGSITQGLEALDQWMTKIAGEMGQFTSLTEYNEVNDWIPYQFVAIHNFPAGFDERDIKILDRIITNGKTLGLFVVLLNSVDRWVEINSKSQYSQDQWIANVLSKDAMEMVHWFELTDAQTRVYTQNTWYDCSIQFMRDDHTIYIDNMVAFLNQERKQDNLFENLFDIEQSFGEYDSTEGLNIPFAITRKGEILEYHLGNAMNAHGLICGGTGSGKSTLLHMLISSIVMNYSPDDVEIWLADYKITEFYSYKTNTPPHIGFIGLSKTVDFSYAFIDKITEEMNQRQSIIAEADYLYKNSGGRDNITSFADYRKIYGTYAMKRLIVIIDEFHVMSQHAQAEQAYKTKLENILAEARAMGIIMLFSDQAIVDGLRGLSDKARKQIKARIALSNYYDELKETLGSEKNKEELLQYVHMGVGEVAIQTVIENDDKEEKETIERAIAILINGANRYQVNEKARKVYHAEDYLADSFDDRVIEAMNMSDINKWEEKMPAQHRDGSKDLQIYLGKPVDLQFAMQFSLLRRNGNNIMSVSGSEEEQMRILQSVIRSFQRQKEYEILVLSDTYAPLFCEYEPEIRAFADKNEKIKIYDQLNDICYQIHRILSLVNKRDNSQKVLVIWLGLDALADLMAEESTVKPKSLLGEPKKEISVSDSQRIGVLDGEKRDEFEDAFDSLFGLFDDEDDEDEIEAEDVLEEEKILEDFVYNAREDISRIIHMGPSRNVFNLVIYDTASSLRDFREVKNSDFKHKIAFAMSDNEAGDFLDRSNLIRDLPEHMAYYHNGRMGRKFIPYKL